MAGFHPLVGLAAVLVVGAAFYALQAFGLGEPGRIAGGSLVEMALA